MDKYKFHRQEQQLSNLIPAFGLSAYASFSGDERQRGIATQEQRKSSQRDALIEGPYPQGEASWPGRNQSINATSRL
ncbi:hypothetical protein A3841_14950 [Pontibacter flavimaris]|uniref:Uncharacterized protein n=1 Tax=Pontibacter flavimaris TaxID=1797110 RepID=A0A1Q5PFU1_9BACT|nr:hypothetical protein A3841_14950 [Pontibacter flavimaris]